MADSWDKIGQLVNEVGWDVVYRPRLGVTVDADLARMPIRATRRRLGLGGRTGFGWDSWVLHPAGIWLWVGRTLTRRGAINKAHSFRRVVAAR